MTRVSDKNLILSIGEAAKLVGVSAATLRRMDDRGLIDSVRTSTRGKRSFFKADLLNIKHDGYKLAKTWIKPGKRPELKKFEGFYYSDEGLINGEVTVGMRERLSGLMSDDHISVVISATIELVNNAFYHNQGQWPDVEGVFYFFDRSGQRIIIADRGVGLLQNLQTVRPDITTHKEVLKVAFTEQISSRPVEGHRGYGLKHARQCVVSELKRLVFQTGNARLEVRAKDDDLYIDEVSNPIQGCLAIIEF